MLLNASGGVYSEGPKVDLEMAVKYVTSMMNFFGVKNIETIIIEGHSQFPDKAEEIIVAGLEKAVKVSRTF
ncbi:FMN-dependent NADH-azoreductase 1 [compost metagenome]